MIKGYDRWLDQQVDEYYGRDALCEGCQTRPKKFRGKNYCECYEPDFEQEDEE